MDQVPDWDYNIIIDIPFGYLFQVHEWCRENLPDDDWAIDVLDLEFAGRYRFFFRTEESYFKFILWMK